jgi:hypothetical protein
MPSVGNPRATADGIRRHLEELTYNPHASVPPSLAGFNFQRLQSCTDVRTNPLGPAGGGRREVDMKFVHHTGTEEANGSHAEPTLDKLLEPDIGTMQSLFDICNNR